jgi:hypothetical protein
MTVANDNDTCDWAADCNGEGRERAVRDGGDSGVVMMALAVKDGGGGQRRQRQTTTAADDNGMQDWVADYEGDGQGRAWLGIPIFGSDFWDTHQKQNSDCVFDFEDSGRNFFLEFRC